VNSKFPWQAPVLRQFNFQKIVYNKRGDGPFGAGGQKLKIVEAAIVELCCWIAACFLRLPDTFVDLFVFGFRRTLIV
jgi:hypothetical protein